MRGIGKTGGWAAGVLAVASALLATGLALAPQAAPAQRANAALLDRIEPGQWQVLRRDGQSERAALCIASGHGLIQLRHAHETCRSFVVEDTPVAVTIHYECPGNGYGQTRLRAETPRLVQIDTQGVAGGLPFAFSAEARKVGVCGR